MNVKDLLNFLGPFCALMGCLSLIGYTMYPHVPLRSPARGPARKNWKLLLLGLFLLALSVLLFYYEGGSGSFSAWLKNSDPLHKFALTIIVLVAIVIFAEAISPRLIDPNATIDLRHKMRRSIQWLRAAAMAAAIFVIWGPPVENLGVFLGIVGAGLALSLQEILLSIAGWGYIWLKKPFDISDRIEISEKIGDVIDIGLLHTTMIEVGNWVLADQSTGRLVIVSNSAFLREAIFNYTKGFPFVWNELQVIVTFESDWRRAKELILELSREEDHKIASEVRRQIDLMQKSYAIMRYRELGSIVYTSIAANGVALTLRYLTPVRARRTTEHKLNEGVLDAFAKEESIDFAYPTTRYYDNTSEGKVGARIGKEE